MQRRRYLSVAATGALAAIAGCSGGDDGGDERAGNGGSDDEQSGTENGADGEDDGTGDGENGDGENGNGDGTDEPVPTEFASIRAVDGHYDPDARRFPSGTGRRGRSFRFDPFALEDGLTVATFEHIVGSEFAVELLDGDGESAASIVDHRGPIEGAAAVPTVEGDYSLDVTEVGGYWVIWIAQPRTPAAAVRRPPVAASGTGPDVVGTVELDGTATISASHGGESPFRLRCYDEDATGAADTALVFDEEGTFEGETTIQFDAATWIGVEADGEWTFEVR